MLEAKPVGAYSRSSIDHKIVAPILFLHYNQVKPLPWREYRTKINSNSKYLPPPKRGCNSKTVRKPLKLSGWST